MNVWRRVAACFGVWMFLCASAMAEDNVVEGLIHEALLSTMPAPWYPDSEFFAEGHTILEMQEKDDTLEIYLAASVGGYGFEGGAFILQNGWGGPCTVILKREEGEWTIGSVLEIEDYSEIPTIMPQSAENKFFNSEYDNTRQLEEQLEAYLQSIGRTEPISDYATVGGELSNMFAVAGNFRMRIVEDAYPLGNTTKERLENGERFLYTRAWEPDEDGVIDPVFQTEQGLLQDRGTTGTETLTKVRKADGKLLETTVIRVDLDRLTITMTDDYGSVQYVFPFDGWDYGAPMVFDDGECRMDRTRIEQACAELSTQIHADTEAERVVLAETNELGDERFSLVRVNGTYNSLVYSRRINEEWTEIWENPDIVPQQAFGSVVMYGDAQEEGAVYEYPRFNKTYEGATLSLYTGDLDADHETFGLMLEKIGDEWKVSLYNDHVYNRYAYLFDDKVLLNAADFSALQTAGLLFTAIDRSAERFDPAQISAAQEELRKDVQGTVRVDYFADAEPLYIALGRNVLCPVHVAPDEKSPRAAKGKAAVSLKDWVVVLCKEENWLMVLYETGKGQYRTGWIDALQDEALMEAAEVTMPARFQNRLVEISTEIQLFDDPVHRSGTVCQVPSGSRVMLLWEGDIEGYRSDVAYAEVYLDGETWRGFMKRDPQSEK